MKIIKTLLLLTLFIVTNLKAQTNIISHPRSVDHFVGETASFTVKFIPISFATFYVQWQEKSPWGGWRNIYIPLEFTPLKNKPGVSNTLEIKVKRSKHGYSYRCLVKGFHLFSGRYEFVSNHARLKVIDDRYARLDVEEDIVENNVGKKNIFKVYPNPTSNNVTIDLSGNDMKKGQYKLTVTDLTGKIVSRTTKFITNEISTLLETIELKNYDSGMYFLTVEDPSGNLKVKNIMKR